MIIEGLTLNEVNEAIRTILIGGQSYRIGTQTVTRADLQTLYSIQKDLENAQSGSSGGGIGRQTAVGIWSGR